MVIQKEGRYILRDLKERWLILIVSYGGSMIFYLEKKIKNVSVRIKIGRFPDLSIAYARKSTRVERRDCQRNKSNVRKT